LAFNPWVAGFVGISTPKCGALAIVVVASVNLLALPLAEFPHLVAIAGWALHVVWVFVCGLCLCLCGLINIVQPKCSGRAAIAIANKKLLLLVMAFNIIALARRASKLYQHQASHPYQQHVLAIITQAYTKSNLFMTHFGSKRLLFVYACVIIFERMRRRT